MVRKATTPAAAGKRAEHRDLKCPREAASGTLTEEFGTNQSGAAAAAKWLQETRRWISETFDKLCAHDTSCPKTQIVIHTTSALNPATEKMVYTMTFRVICSRT